MRCVSVFTNVSRPSDLAASHCHSLGPYSTPPDERRASASRRWVGLISGISRACSQRKRAGLGTRQVPRPYQQTGTMFRNQVRIGSQQQRRRQQLHRAIACCPSCSATWHNPALAPDPIAPPPPHARDPLRNSRACRYPRPPCIPAVRHRCGDMEPAGAHPPDRVRHGGGQAGQRSSGPQGASQCCTPSQCRARPSAKS